MEAINNMNTIDQVSVSGHLLPQNLMEELDLPPNQVSHLAEHMFEDTDEILDHYQLYVQAFNPPGPQCAPRLDAIGNQYMTLAEIQANNQRYHDIARWASEVEPSDNEASFPPIHNPPVMDFRTFIKQCPTPRPQRQMQFFWSIDSDNLTMTEADAQGQIFDDTDHHYSGWASPRKRSCVLDPRTNEAADVHAKHTLNELFVSAMDFSWNHRPSTSSPNVLNPSIEATNAYWDDVRHKIALQKRWDDLRACMASPEIQDSHRKILDSTGEHEDYRTPSGPKLEFLDQLMNGEIFPPPVHEEPSDLALSSSAEEDSSSGSDEEMESDSDVEYNHQDKVFADMTYPTCDIADSSPWQCNQPPACHKVCLSSAETDPVPTAWKVQANFFSMNPLPSTHFLHRTAQELSKELRDFPARDLGELMQIKAKLESVHDDIVRMKFSQSTKRVELAKRRGKFVPHLTLLW